MKKFFIIIILFFASLNIHAFDYFGVGLAPNFHISGDRPMNYFIQGEWQPHKVLGARLFVGFHNGLWVGTAINFKQSLMRAFHYSYWDVNFSIPLVFNLHTESRSVFVGITANTTFSFDITGAGRHYFYITPIEIWFTPAVLDLHPVQKWRKDMSVSYMFCLGFRRSI